MSCWISIMFTPILRVIQKDIVLETLNSGQCGTIFSLMYDLVQ